MRSLLVLSALALASVSLALGIGDKAPPLKLTTVVKGPTPDLSKGIHVVEFWAPYSAEASASIPTLSDLAKKYQGKLDVTGISIWEGEDVQDQLGRVQKFVAQMGPKMDYAVAYDGDSSPMQTEYMDAAHVATIPTAFLIKDGTVLWIGHPMGGLKAEIDKTLNGKYDPAVAKVEFAKWQADTAHDQAEAQRKAAEFKALMLPVTAAMQDGDEDAALVELDKIEAKRPEFKATLAPIRYSVLVDSGSPKLVALATKFATDTYKDNPEALNEFAWNIVDPESKLTKPNYDAALILSKRAAEASKMKDGSILDTYALALFKTGDKKKALEIQTKAVELVKKDKDTEPATIKELEGRLEEYKKANA